MQDPFTYECARPAPVQPDDPTAEPAAPAAGPFDAYEEEDQTAAE
ncbi:hypothetical protein [Streptomyces sp. ISL-98]|nr:hypothetical protein [Streptomyces sp. ISL-98]